MAATLDAFAAPGDRRSSGQRRSGNIHLLERILCSNQCGCMWAWGGAASACSTAAAIFSPDVATTID